MARGAVAQGDPAAGRDDTDPHRERLDEALERVETTLLFAPDVAALWRESGLLSAKLDRVEAAVAALEQFLRLNPGDSARFQMSVLLQELRGRLT